MTAPVWAAELADRFWALAGPPPPFPRDLAGPAVIGLPVNVVTLPGLTLGGVRAYFARAQVPCPVTEPDRRLRACLVARVGHGFVFVDADDPADERRFSLAHEVAHFLRDYDAVRRAVSRRVGPAALGVLDGVRPATPAERVQAVVRGVPMAAHVHLLRRDDDGRPRSAAEREAEAAADRLAFELLAPADQIAPDLGRSGVLDRLITVFGLPPVQAAAYSAILLPPPPPSDPFLARLRQSR